jgi:hypothetical protein
MINIQEPDDLKTYAHISQGKVVNVSLWNGKADFQPKEQLVEIPKDSAAGIGWDYINGKFVDNRPNLDPYSV